MKKNLFVLLSVLVLTSILLIRLRHCRASPPRLRRPRLRQLPPKLRLAKTVKKIAFFVSDLSNVFHQAQAAEAKKYAKEKYGADVFVFDGKADSAQS